MFRPRGISSFHYRLTVSFPLSYNFFSGPSSSGQLLISLACGFGSFDTCVGFGGRTTYFMASDILGRWFSASLVSILAAWPSGVHRSVRAGVASSVTNRRSDCQSNDWAFHKI